MIRFLDKSLPAPSDNLGNLQSGDPLVLPQAEHGNRVMIDFTEKKWRFEERVKRLVDKGLTETEARDAVKRVIETKEVPQDEQQPQS